MKFAREICVRSTFDRRSTDSRTYPPFSFPFFIRPDSGGTDKADRREMPVKLFSLDDVFTLLPPSNRRKPRLILQLGTPSIAKCRPIAFSPLP